MSLGSPITLREVLRKAGYPINDDQFISMVVIEASKLSHERQEFLIKSLQKPPEK